MAGFGYYSGAQGLVLVFGSALWSGCSSGVASAPEPPAPTQDARDKASSAAKANANAFERLGTSIRTANTQLSASVAATGILTVTPRVPGTVIAPSAGCAFNTVGIARGSGTSALLAAPSIDAQGRVRLEREGAVELVSARGDGLEQQWDFATAPRGNGALRIAVAVTGCIFVRDAGNGMLFRDGLSRGPGLVYGSAWWRDATGARARLATKFSGGKVTVTVPGSMLDHAIYPASVDPILSVESEVDSPLIVPTAADRVVAGNGQYAVFAGGRMGIVDTTGHVLTPINGLSVLDARPDSIAFNGQYYLAVGVRAAANPDPNFGIGGDIYAERIAIDGAVLDSTLVVSGNHLNISPSLASNGSTFLMSWADYIDEGNGYEFVSAILGSGNDGALSISTPNTFVHSEAGQPRGTPQSAFTGASYAVAYPEEPSISHAVHALYEAPPFSWTA